MMAPAKRPGGKRTEPSGSAGQEPLVTPGEGGNDPSPGETDEMDFHRGETLYREAKNHYRTAMLAAVEAAQNGIDANAENIFIGIDLLRRTMWVIDDGLGITRDKFQEALLSIGKGIKRGGLGRFGVGMISPLNKCTTYMITSQPVGGRDVNRWSFVGETIRTQHHKVNIPYEKLQTLPAIPEQFAAEVGRVAARWRTFITLDQLVNNEAITDVKLDELEGHIRTKLRRGMLNKGTTIYVMLINKNGQTETRTINPTAPSGEPLPVIEYDDPVCGKAVFELFIAREISGRRIGAVDVMQLGDNTAISWSEFRLQAIGRGFHSDMKPVFRALGSGFFEGTISFENVELNVDRDKFEISPALNAAYVLIYQWFLEHGQALYQEDKSLRREERYKTLGERTLEQLFEKLEGNDMLAPLRFQLLGQLPARRANDTPPGLPLPRDPRKPGAPRVVATRPESPSARPPRDKKPVEPKIPAGFNLDFAYDLLPNSIHLWELDCTTGILTFNIRHPTWVQMDETQGEHTAVNDSMIIELQQFTALAVLILLARVGVDEFESSRQETDELIQYYAAMFIDK